AWLWPPRDPLGRLIEESRPQWQRGLRWLGRQMARSYAITLAIWLALIPLVAARYQMVSFVGLLIGPPLVLLTSIALVSGFLVLLMAAVCAPLVLPFAWATRWSLAGCDLFVHVGDALPGSHWYSGDVPEWWLWVYYVGFLAFLVLRPLQRHWRW